jgi:hypothetical protein
MANALANGVMLRVGRAERLPVFSQVYLTLSLACLMVGALADGIMLRVAMVDPTEARSTCQEPTQVPGLPWLLSRQGGCKGCSKRWLLTLNIHNFVSRRAIAILTAVSDSPLVWLASDMICTPVIFRLVTLVRMDFSNTKLAI